MPGLTYGFEVNKAPLNIDRYQLHTKPVADIQALKATPITGEPSCNKGYAPA